MSAGDWDIYARCECGWLERAPFGDRFHIHREVCPDCGRPKHEWDLVTGRYGDNGFETLPDPPRTSQPGGCLVHTSTAAVVLFLLGAWFTSGGGT